MLLKQPKVRLRKVIFSLYYLSYFKVIRVTLFLCVLVLNIRFNYFVCHNSAACNKIASCPQGKTSSLLGASAALLLNALKELAGQPHSLHIISPESIEPIQKLKVDYLKSKNPRLHTDEVLIALSASAAASADARLALEQLPKLEGCQAHTSVMLSDVDLKIFKKLGVQVTCEAV